MNSKLKKGLIAGGIFIVVFVMLNILKTDIHVERTKNIKADLEVLKTETSNFKHFSTWSPWAELDPEATSEFKGEVGTVGSEFHWSSKSEDVGTGYMKVTSISDERVNMDLVFTAPWESESKVYYTFANKGDGVDVTWGYDGDMPILMSWFINMDEMLGGQYEKGLTSLKEKVEK